MPLNLIGNMTFDSLEVSRPTPSQHSEPVPTRADLLLMTNDKPGAPEWR